MRQQVNDDRIRAHQLLHLTQETLKLKLHIDDELSHINTVLNDSWFDINSLNQLKAQILLEIELEKDNRQVKMIKIEIFIFFFYFSYRN